MDARVLLGRKFRTTTHHSARVSKAAPISQFALHAGEPRKPQTAFSSTHTVNKNAEQYRKKIGLNDEIIFRRKENMLNTQYNRRISALKQITKDNKQLYKRINSQKSLYSQEDMRKSTTSIRSLSRSSSRVSQKSKSSAKNKAKPASDKNSKNNTVLSIQPESIYNVKTNMAQFRSIFLKEKSPQKVKKQQSSLTTRHDNRSFSLREQPRNEKGSFGLGNILHRIAEQMEYIPPPNANPKRRRLLY